MKYFLHVIILLLLSGCSNEPKSNKQTDYPKPPLPPTNFGVVVTYDSIALNVKDTIFNEDYYKLLNETILPTGKCDYKKKVKVLNITTLNVQESLKYIDLNPYFSKEEIEFLKTQSTNPKI